MNIEKPILGERAKPPSDRAALRRYVRIFYDLQRIRLQVGGRNRAQKIELHEIDLARLAAREAELRKVERDALHDVEECLRRFPFYTNVLKGRYRGLGPTMAGVIMAEFDVEKATTVSKMWAFAGLHTEIDPKNPELRRAPRPRRGEKLPYNAWLRTKLVGVLAECLIKAKSPVTKFYYDYKHRKATAGWGKSDGHRHNAAKRYMIKMLLADLWAAWREFAGLPIRLTYHEEYQGHIHGAGPAVESAPLDGELSDEVDAEMELLEGAA